MGWWRQHHRRCCRILCALAFCLAAAPAAHSAGLSRPRSSLLGGRRAAALQLRLPRRQLLVEEFKSAPSAAEKEEEAAKILAHRPDTLLRNLKVKAQANTEMYPEGCEVTEAGTKQRAKTLTEGADNLVETAGACAAACKDSKACNAWFWCDDAGGCETEAGLALPRHACQLQTQRISFPIEPPAAWKASRFVAGYEGASGPKKPVPAEKRVAVVAPITTDRCPLAYGLVSLKQAFVNKHDYARLHSYEFHSRPVARDPALPGTWYRLHLIKQALAEVPAERAGWVLFADQDVLVDEMGFKVPFAKYAGKDLVLWGSAKLVAADSYQSLLSVSHKDRQQGLDTGVLLLRNSDWSREFVDAALAFLKDEAKQELLKTSLKTWEPLLYEQNAVAYLLQGAARLERVAFESEYCINCAWAHGLQGKLPFLKRFSECSFCTGARNSREQMYECNTELVKTFGFSNRMALGIVGCGQRGGQSEAVNPTDPGPRAGGGGGGSGAVSQHLQYASSTATGPNPVMVFAGFMRTHFFTMVFVGVFFASFVRRRRRTPPA